MASKLEKHNGKWTFRYKSADNIHKRYICNSLVYQIAEEERIDFLHKNKKSVVTKDGEYDIETLTWNGFLELYIKYVLSKKKDKHVDKRVIFLINNILNPILLKDLTTQKLRFFIAERESTGISKSTVNREMNCIRSMWTYAINGLKVKFQHQVKDIKKYKTKTIVKDRILTLPEIQKIKTEIKSETILTAIYLMLYLGLRLKEAYMLKWSDLNFESNLIRIEPQKTEDANPDEAYLPVTDILKEYLLKLKLRYPNTEYIIPNAQQSYSTASHFISLEFKKIGLKDVTAHTLRHTYISYLFMTAFQIGDIMDWARITSLKTLKVYKHLSPKYQSDNINRLPY